MSTLYNDIGPLKDKVFCYRLFDRLNSRLPCGFGDKGALTPENLLEVEAFFLLAEEELRSLTHLDGRQVIHSQQQTFIVGYITNMKASIALAKELFSEGTSYSYLLLYRLSQDALEHFFGDLRSRGHWCLNPTPLYFIYSYRALVSNRLQLYGLSQGRNCMELQVLDISANSGMCCADLLPIADGNADGEQHIWETILHKLHSRTAGPLRQNILFYMAGWAARQVLKVLRCEECRAALVTMEPYQAFLSRLTMVKQKGGLMYASRSTYRVVLLADRALEHELIKRDGQPPRDKQFLAQLLLVIFQTCAVDRHVFGELADHDSSSLLDQHVPRLIKLLAGKYLKARLGHLGNEYTTSRVGAASSKRNQRTRAVIFSAL